MVGKVNNLETTSLENFKPALSSTFKNQLVEHAKKLQDMFFELTSKPLRELAFDIAKALTCLFIIPTKRLKKTG